MDPVPSNILQSTVLAGPVSAMDPVPSNILQSTVLAGTGVQVVSNTWARDSHDLFDFEAHQLHTKTFTVLRSMKCIRCATEVQMVSELTPTAPGTDPLLRLVQKDGTFWVDKATPSSSYKKLWLVVRDLATCGHRLVESDIIKLGRFKFRVRQMVASDCGDIQPELRLDDNGAACGTDASAKGELNNVHCRICLLEGPSEDDPLIAPCRCKGSIEHVHLGCLRHWIKGRLNFSDAAGGSYFFRPLACELCKGVYQTTVQCGTERTPLVEVPRTQPPFIVLENMVRDSQQHTSRGLHVISLAEKVLKLGRGHESDVRIADVSISRCHATIRFHRGHFWLEDNNSKFGTLVAMKKPRALEVGAPISIQMGRTVIALSMQTAADLAGQDLPNPLLQLPGSSAEDERALRLSLLHRVNTREESSADVSLQGAYADFL
eukprot:TRINITY_DN4575_c0_g3_i1.p1 TRINITY_DN4575_c0_g3~~TRINITY_DN4575_c0_g3_i1.p1  ORF type:complete len:433 (-),score=70.09 TRINITY_DN4575_c0_g3_i1:67-1365(-)